MSHSTRARLSLLMFVQFFIWGCWWVPLGTYLNAIGFDGVIGNTYATQGYAAIITPLFVGAVADRYFSAEKVLGILHLLGGAILFWISTIGGEGSSAVFFWGVMAYMLCYMPTIPLSCAVVFNAVQSTEKEFPAIRVLGTIGWIVAGLLVAVFAAEATALPIQISAIASLALGLYSFTLPGTPPRGRGEKFSVLQATGIDVIWQVKDRSYWIFILCSLLICIPLSFYYAYTNTFLNEVGVGATTAVQSLGQGSEILFMLLLPFFLRRFGIKWVLMVGMLAWAVRYVLFAYGFTEAGPVMTMLVAGILLHGICYDFFFVAGQIHTDNQFDPETRARAQSFLTLMTLGVGTVVGSNLANMTYVANTVSAAPHNWLDIWLLPAALAIFVTVLFAFTFKPGKVSQITPSAS